MLVKCSLGQVNRLAGEQQLLALPAVKRAGQLIRTHAVGGLAMGADDVQRVAYTAQLVAGGGNARFAGVPCLKRGRLPILPLLFS